MSEPYIPTLRELPVELLPRNRMFYAGPGALTTSELLSLILGSGRPGCNAIRLAETLLVHFGGLRGIALASDAELQQIAGIGPAKAAKVRSAFEIGRRLLSTAPTEKVQVRSPADVANLVMLEMGLLEQEHLRTVLLDTKNVVQRVVNVYAGNLNTAVVRIGEVFREAIRSNCAGIIIVHNHPSGDPTPSPEDVRVTEQLVEAGKLVDIEVLDHLVIGHNRYVSLKERGLGFR
jgi:DNA repair protein RadC